jgi:hypothetical protein
VNQRERDGQKEAAREGWTRKNRAQIHLMEMDGKWGAQQQKQHNVNSRRSLKKGEKNTNEEEDLKKRTTSRARRSFPPAFLSFSFSLFYFFFFRFFHL